MCQVQVCDSGSFVALTRQAGSSLQDTIQGSQSRHVVGIGDALTRLPVVPNAVSPPEGAEQPGAQRRWRHEWGPHP